MTQATPILRVNLSVGYRDRQTLHEVAFTLHPGERVGIVGSSGAGKSTLVLALLGLLSWRGGWVRGSLHLNARDLLKASESDLRTIRGREIALVPQSPLTSLNPALRLETHFQQVWLAHRSRDAAALRRRMEELLARVQLPDNRAFLRRKPGEISIGQAQRVLIALALLHQPAMLLADEPTSALDACTQDEVLQLFDEVCSSRGTTLLYVSHDLLSVFRLCDRMLVMDHGTLVEDVCLTGAEITASHPATLALLRTLPAAPELLWANRTRGRELSRSGPDNLLPSPMQPMGITDELRRTMPCAMAV